MKRIWNVIRELRWLSIFAVALAVVAVVLAVLGHGISLTLPLIGLAVILAWVDRQ